MAGFDAIRKRLEAKRDELRRRAAGFDEDRSHDEEPVSPDFAEQVVERETDDVLDALSDAAWHELRQIQHALERMDEGIYDECEVCGEEIPLKRLEALPFSTLCVQCAEKREG